MPASFLISNSKSSIARRRSSCRGDCKSCLIFSRVIGRDYSRRGDSTKRGTRIGLNSGGQDRELRAADRQVGKILDHLAVLAGDLALVAIQRVQADGVHV